MKWIKELFFMILGTILVLYILGSLNQGTFDISLWSESARSGVSIISGFAASIITLFKIFLG